MTEYETAYLFKELIDSAGNATINYVSVLFGFLVAGYLAAPRLSKAMSGILVGLFVFFALMMIFTVNRTMAVTASLVNDVRLSAAGGDTALAWHPIVYEPANFIEYFVPLYTGLLIASFVAALVFFFHCRRGGVGGKIVP